MKDKTRKEQVELLHQRLLPKYYEQIADGFCDPAQEAFELTKSDNCSARDYANTFAELGVTPETVRDENKIDILEDQKAFLQIKVARLREWVDQMRDIAPHIVVEDEKELNILEKRLDRIVSWEHRVKEKLDNNLRPKEEATGDYVPTHWMQAKLYWGYILNYVVQEGRKLNKEQVLRLYKKVTEAKRKNNISSWFYYVLADWCVTKLNMPKEKQKLLNYAMACKQKALKNGRKWPPKGKEPEGEVKIRPFFISLDQIINVDEDGNPWRLEDILPDHTISEDEIIDAIDKRRKVV